MAAKAKRLMVALVVTVSPGAGQSHWQQQGQVPRQWQVQDSNIWNLGALLYLRLTYDIKGCTMIRCICDIIYIYIYDTIE